MIEGSFDFKQVEKTVSELWDKNQTFKYTPDESKPAYTIVLPPPNITGSLHVGHALCFTIQDILIRYKRMSGFNVLWQAGLDHAGIVTQLLVEKHLASKGIDPKSLTREELLKEIWDWKEKSGSSILNQMHKLGCSIDLSRVRFTMDKESNRAVIETFVKLYEDGLIYKDTKLVNWDPKLQSAISDLEVVDKEEKGKLYYIKYQITRSNEYVTVATTRPETLFGDTAVAVNPGDERYKNLVGKTVTIPLCNREIPVIADEHSNPEKGSGVVKITPAHDFNDFEVGKRHDLEIINVLDKNACMNQNVPEEFIGLDRYDARKLVIEKLESIGLLEKVEDIQHVVPYGDRSNVVIEPYMTEQWFLDASRLAVEAIRTVEDGGVSFVPKNWENTYFEWMRNIRPWCLSRQIKWGHQIPAWYGPDKKIFVARTEEDAIKAADAFYGHRVELTRDTDVLDTWYSSSLWPFSTLGWPSESKLLDRNYPNNVLVTGFDIIFFWVARMIMMGMYFNKKPPFKNVYIHALVRDSHGNKMSKSKGNVVDPIELIDEFGADALRFSMAAFSTPGRDICISKERINGYKGLFVKLWNSIKFAQMNECTKPIANPKAAKVIVNKWIIAKLASLHGSIETSVSAYRFDEYANSLYQFFWGDFCDWYIEISKVFLKNGSTEEVEETKGTIYYVLENFLKFLSPIAPFISGYLNKEYFQNAILTTSDFPILACSDESTNRIEFIQDVITEIRSLRKEFCIPYKQEVAFRLQNKTLDPWEIDVISSLAKVKYDSACDSNLRMIVHECELILHAEGIDLDTPKTRLAEELEKISNSITSTEARLANEKFITNAPQNVVDESRKQLESMKIRQAKINQLLGH